MVIFMFLQFLICMIATLSFAILFCAPKSQLIFCGMTGAFGWIVYLLLIENGIGSTVANLIAAFTLTVISRTIAAIRKTPVTVYLIAGIFPLVPGAGIYYTSYYFIMNEMDHFSQAGTEAITIAGSIVLGIIFGFALPQSWFHAIQRNASVKSGRK